MASRSFPAPSMRFESEYRGALFEQVAFLRSDLQYAAFRRTHYFRILVEIVLKAGDETFLLKILLFLPSECSSSFCRAPEIPRIFRPHLSQIGQRVFNIFDKLVLFDFCQNLPLPDKVARTLINRRYSARGLGRDFQYPAGMHQYPPA